MESILLFLIHHFPDLLDVNLTASIVILFVICVRQFLKGAPKIFSYALWGIVLLRLLVPISIECPVSFVPERTEFSSMVEINEVLPEIQFETPQDRADNEWQQQTTPPGEPLVQTCKTMDAETYLTFSWLTGIAGMLLYSTVSYLKLRRRIKAAVLLRRGVYIADDIDTPFVMGIFRPAVYLPSTLADSERHYIIAHERHHIRRGDHIFKALGFLALTIHWFNPLVWVSFHFASRDMEMSCDEAVIHKLGESFRADYSQTLLNLATGHRQFVGTPLAFGEDDPAGRVRNLAKWKKPAIWVIVVCVIVCIILAVCLLTDPEIPQSDKWEISLYTERISRTGAHVLFDRRANAETAEIDDITYGDDLSLERLENGQWVAVEELPGYEYYVGDSSYPVVDGYGMVHEWQNRFGELPDGHYRVGKLVTVRYTDGTSEQSMFHTEFILPDPFLNGPIPLENLPEKYSAEQAMLDGCFVQTDGVARENKELFHQFATVTQAGVPSFIRIVDWHYGDNAHYVAYDLEFDGTLYTITWLVDGQRYSREFPYLRHITGENENPDEGYDTYEHYVLVHDDQVTTNIWGSLIGSHANAFIDHMTVYSDHGYLLKTPQIPTNLARATLKFRGDDFATTTDFDRLEKLYLLFTDAEFLGYEPKTHSIGVMLDLLLTTQDGKVLVIELDPDNDLCRIGGEYVIYGKADEPCYIEKLWYYLGIPAWPDAVYEYCENAFRLQGVG